MLSVFLQFYRFTFPSLILVFFWALYKSIIKKDQPMGLVLLLALQIIVDGYLNTGLYIPGFTVGSIRFSEIFFILIFFSYLSKKNTKIEPLIRNLLLIYYILFFIAALRGITITYGIFTFRALVIPQVIATWIAFKGFEEAEDYHKFFYYLSILLIFMGLFVFWDKFFNMVFLKSSTLGEAIYWQNRGNNRFGSFFLNPNMYGSFIVLILMSLFTCIYWVKGWLKNGIVTTGLLLTLLGIVLTGSRGPVLAVGISIIVYIFLPNQIIPFAKRAKILFVGLILLTLLMPGFFTSATRRFTEEQSAASTSMEHVSRLSLWIATIEIISNHPLLGVGLGEETFKRAVAKETNFIEKYGYTLDNPHSSYLQLCVMTGVLSLVVFFLLNFIIINRAIKSLTNENAQRNMLFTSSIIAGIIGYLFSLAVDMSLFTKVAQIYWTMFGLLYSMTRIKITEE